MSRGTNLFTDNLCMCQKWKKKKDEQKSLYYRVRPSHWTTYFIVDQTVGGDRTTGDDTRPTWVNQCLYDSDTSMVLRDDLSRQESPRHEEGTTGGSPPEITTTRRVRSRRRRTRDEKRSREWCRCNEGPVCL